jgi:hypothetical protein
MALQISSGGYAETCTGRSPRQGNCGPYGGARARLCEVSGSVHKVRTFLENILNFRRRETQGSITNELDLAGVSPLKLFVSLGGCTYSKITGAGPGILAHIKCEQMV